MDGGMYISAYGVSGWFPRSRKNIEMQIVQYEMTVWNDLHPVYRHIEAF